MNKYLIIGLGNPYKLYKYTRHNIGYLILKLIIKKNKIKKYNKNKYGYIYKLKLNNNIFYLLLPNLYMNENGKSVYFFLKNYKIKKKNLITISDDIYLKFGIIKKKYKSGHGGHNGLKSIDNILKTIKYLKIKIGIGHNFEYGNQNKYVLSKMKKKEIKFIKKHIYKKIFNIIINL
ncbi:MAG: aminoacyl-tRNA hydrolase [Candidatus Shikimatogenerans bostrichidophilus]|nr:MAG: aminoacyl-tRNA hydrolase [Candidatus Shikimatogenerans bostrichidophilus]